ncbi:TIGR04086 family membrane protein [Fredinandcohnia quinoae]|uniref:TIGR04086 family membrane protein n=1 Tax=Fredinandcohnia quinoae TaxID=2918902 RepID=A0AAW5E0U9_9BACI|nr:TIGR04086 family membrane protein [Fredinandcohnia sp. SECRCQ15]MCH1626537.1 TIGR04086 family membrane protein [Fredinandcohnia sp. SECRCQ15]
MGVAIFYGVIAIFIIVILFSLLFSLLLKFTSVQESSLSWVILASSFIALFIGGFVSGGKGKEKGWLIGGGTGLLYSVIVFLIQYLGYDATFTAEQAMYHLGFLAIAIIGGIFGVNMSTPSRREA